MKKSFNQNIFLSTILFFLLALPIYYIIQHNERTYSFIKTSEVSLLLSLLLLSFFSFFSKVNAVVSKVIFICMLYFLFFIRLIQAFVYDFSGRGFSSEFFAHFSWESFIIGLSEYGFTFILSVLLLILLSVFLYRLLSKIHSPKNFTNLVIISITLITLFLLKNQIPEWRLYQAYTRYYSTSKDIKLDKLTARKMAKQTLFSLRNTDALPVEKRNVVATLGKIQKNIIIIYLESFSDILTENKKYPNLTPNIDKLKHQFLSFKNNFSSAYVTIEGIANSQCGTLMNMDNGNNSLTSKAGRLPNLPCLGDILEKVAYKQVFYGGADLAFAGKGAFFQEHGYDEIKGRAFWSKNNIGEQNQWGLTDADLFDISYKKIQELSKQQQPFNFTLLTLGTHIPGFTYKGCKPYTQTQKQNKFLDAIHCTDYLLGKFIQQLQDSTILKDTVVYIQGDHSIFPTHDMREIFAEKSTDKKILTIIIDQTITHDIDQQQPTSTYNMVSNILDLLGIKHNVKFIFARSDFNKVNRIDKPYLMTRYNDYFGLQSLYNINNDINCDLKTDISLPLDSCEKQQALNALYQLDASYSEQIIDQQVCLFNTKLSYKNKNDSFQIQWGNLDASELFFSQGRMLKEPKKGFYLLKLNKRDDIISQLFYRADDRNDLKKLLRYINTKNARFVLLTNLSSIPRENREILKQLPPIIFKTKFLYAQNIENKIRSLSKENINLGSIEFTPASCKNGFKIINFNATKIQNIKPSKFCAINKWGPKKIRLGEKFNLQPTGQSAFWVITDCSSDHTSLRFNKNLLGTTVRIPTITAAIDDEILIHKAGIYTLELYDTTTGESKKVGDFKVEPSEPY